MLTKANNSTIHILAIYSWAYTGSSFDLAMSWRPASSVLLKTGWWSFGNNCNLTQIVENYLMCNQTKSNILCDHYLFSALFLHDSTVNSNISLKFIVLYKNLPTLSSSVKNSSSSTKIHTIRKI